MPVSLESASKYRQAAAAHLGAKSPKKNARAYPAFFLRSALWT